MTKEQLLVQFFEVTGLKNAEKIEQDFYAVIRGRQKFNVPVDAQIEKFDIEGKCSTLT
jgi:hypothetical protein